MFAPEGSYQGTRMDILCCILACRTAAALTQARADLQGRYDAGKPKRRMDESGGGDGMLHGGGGGSEKVESKAPPLLPMSFLKTSPLTGTRSEKQGPRHRKREAMDE